MTANALFPLMFCLGFTGTAEAKGDVENGKAVYAQRCEQCHGVDGAADGPAAPFTYPRPRVFEENSVYKFADTPDGVIPLETDMYRVIDEGIPGTSMPGFPILSESEKWDLVAFIRSLSEDFSDSDYVEEMIAMPELANPTPIASSPDSIAAGEALYKENMCTDCHGAAGRGDGPNWNTLAEDSWGNTMVPRNLNNPESFRNGHEPIDVYRTVSRGLTGSPMASYRDVISAEDRWHLVNYVLSLAPTPKAVPDERILAARVNDLPTTADDDTWDTAATARFETLAQIIEPPRLFFRSVQYVNAQAVYNDMGVVIKIQWDDRSASTGTNLTDDYADRDGTVYRDTDHPDQFAVQFPAKADKDGARPYFLLGDGRRAVNTWWWRSDHGDEVKEINAKGFGVFQEQAKEAQQIKGSVSFENGRYTMLVQRALTTSDRNDVQFSTGDWIPVGFNAWDGNRGEIGQRRAVSTWYWLYLEPEIPATAHVLPPVMFLLTLGVLGLLVRTTREWAKVESGEQDAPAPMMSPEPEGGTGHYGILVGIMGVLIVGPLVYSIHNAISSDPIHDAIKGHAAVAAATGGFVASADAGEVRAALIAQGVPATLATPHDLSGAHLALEGGMKIDGPFLGAAFRYRDGDHVYVLQSYNTLEGGGVANHTRHIGHSVVRGYEGQGASGVVWTDLATTHVFSGEGNPEAILDLSSKAFWGISGGGAHH